jgi:hypothetical protein
MASSIHLSILDESVMAGEDIVARIRVGGDEPSGLRLELFYVNEYLHRLPAPDTATPAGSNTSMLDLAVDAAVDLNNTGPEEQLEATVVVADATVAPADGSLAGEHEIRLTVPADAPPSAGDTIRWHVRAIADQADGPSEETIADARVAVTPAMVGAAPDEEVYGDGQVGIVLSGGQAARAGESLAGMVVLTTEKRSKFTDVRVRLEARRADEDGIEHFTTIGVVTAADNVATEAGVRQELPFSLPVPVDLPPTFVAKWNLQEYKLVVSAARRMRSDFEAKHRVYIASAAAE